MTKGEQARLTAWRRKVLQQAAGETESVYRRYAIADDRDLRVAVEKLDTLAASS